MDTLLWAKESDNYTRRSLSGSSNVESLYQERLPLAREIREQVEKVPHNPREILDVGCGFGAFSFAFSELYPESKISAVDPGVESIRIAREHLSHRKVELSVGYAHNLQFADAAFDMVLLSMVLQWVPRTLLPRTISEIDRVLGPNGILVILEFLPNRPVTSSSAHDQGVRIFKEDYTKSFTAFPWYREVYRQVSCIQGGEDQQRHISLLRKHAIKDVYLEKPPASEH